MKLKKLNILLLAFTLIFFSLPNMNVKKYSADEDNSTGYSNFSQSYFKHLTTNTGKNYHGSCGYVALGMFLSYYDTFHDDSIIPEDFDKVSEGLGNNMKERNSSPGIHQENISNAANMTSSAFQAKIFELANDKYFQSYLLMLGNELGFFPKSATPGAYSYTSTENIAELLDHYLQYKTNYRITGEGAQNRTFPNFNPADYTVTMKRQRINGETSDSIRRYTISMIEDGIPVLLSIYPKEGSGHAVVAYDYDDDKDEIYCNFGWGSSTTHDTPESHSYPIYGAAITLDWNTPHSCSNNYVVETKDEDGNVISTNTYCYEHKDIITYDHDECNFGAWEKTNTTHTRTCHCTKEEKDLHTFNLNAKYCNVCNYYCNHTYAYQYLNNSLHYTTCSKCSYLKNSPHVFESSTSRYCIDCKRLIMDDGFGQIIGPLSATLVSLNGSYVLPSGNIVLVLEDKEAYYNGTLVFYNRNELPEVA